MTNSQKAAIEEAAKRHAYNCDPDNVNPPKWADHYFSFKEGMKEAIEHPERYGLVPAAHTAALQGRVKELEEIIVGINSCQMVGITWPNELKQKVEKIWEAAE